MQRRTDDSAEITTAEVFSGLHAELKKKGGLPDDLVDDIVRMAAHEHLHQGGTILLGEVPQS